VTPRLDMTFLRIAEDIPSERRRRTADTAQESLGCDNALYRRRGARMQADPRSLASSGQTFARAGAENGVPANSDVEPWRHSLIL